MEQAADIWKEALPVVKNAVTGVGVWSALNNAVPIAIEDGTFVLGLRSKDSDLSGHLRMHQTKRLIDAEVSKRYGSPLSSRVIDGAEAEDWERAKKRDAEARRLQEVAETRVRAEIASKTNWDTVYEQLSRRYASITNKSLPQNKALFFQDALELVVEGFKSQPVRDEINERNFGRCIERISQYTEIPSVLVASLILEKAGDQ